MKPVVICVAVKLACDWKVVGTPNRSPCCTLAAAAVVVGVWRHLGPGLSPVYPSWCPLGGAGHWTVSLQKLQDRLRGADQSAAGRPSSAASEHGLLPGLPVLCQRLVRADLTLNTALMSVLPCWSFPFPFLLKAVF